MGTMVDEALMDETRRVSTLQKISIFIREGDGREEPICTPIR